MDSLFDITGKHILITGASSGIGRRVAVVLAQRGAIIGISGRKIEELEKTREMLEGGKHYIVQADLQEVDDTSWIFDQAILHGGKLDGLVYSAGACVTFPLQITSIAKMDAVFRVNLFSFIDMARNFAKTKYSNGGSIIGISSIASVLPEKGLVLYASTKAAMNTAAAVIAQEVCKKGIRINTILPGIVGTERVKESDLTGLQERQLCNLIPPDDIGKLCVYLLSDASKMVSGRPFYLDGVRF